MLDELRRELRPAWGEAFGGHHWSGLSAFSRFAGAQESTYQRAQLNSLIDSSMEAQDWALGGKIDVGDIAYNVIHLTTTHLRLWHFPLGLRDELPGSIGSVCWHWKVKSMKRMLATLRYGSGSIGFCSS